MLKFIVDISPIIGTHKLECTIIENLKIINNILYDILLCSTLVSFHPIGNCNVQNDVQIIPTLNVPNS